LKNPPAEKLAGGFFVESQEDKRVLTAVQSLGRKKAACIGTFRSFNPAVEFFFPRFVHDGFSLFTIIQREKSMMIFACVA
jgi:hypothetical protein